MSPDIMVVMVHALRTEDCLQSDPWGQASQSPAVPPQAGLRSSAPDIPSAPTERLHPGLETSLSDINEAGPFEKTVSRGFAYGFDRDCIPFRMGLWHEAAVVEGCRFSVFLEGGV